ncbi:unnamed protein product [Lathyrus oleraceus]
MTKILKFVYAIILFLFLFLISVEVESLLPCETDEDCPYEIILPTKPRILLIYVCIHKECELLPAIYPKTIVLV